jgi:UMF1 family MFS transporter
LEEYQPDAVYGYSLTISFFIVVLLSPFLSSLADTIGNKKSFLQFFCYLGATSCMGLAMFTGMHNVFLGLLFSITASVGFWGSLVFYNSFCRILQHRIDRMPFLQEDMFMDILVL